MKNDTTIAAEYSGPLGDLCTDFVRLKRASGLLYNEAGILKRFDALSKDFSLPSKTLTKELALAWCQKQIHESAKTHSARVLVVRHFAIYMVRMGYEAYLPTLMAKYNFGKLRFRAHIYSDTELQRIFHEIDTIQPNGYSPHKHIVMPVMFRLFYGCGLRLSEAVNLKRCDVDLTCGVLTIRNSKFGKSRLVPMDENLTAICREYSKRISVLYPDNEYFFPSHKGNQYNTKTIGAIFRKAYQDAGYSHGGRSKGARIHDFRHTFAVRCLKKWVLNGKELTAALPALSAYLGHADLRGTQFYLQLTADLYPYITERFEQSFGSVIPDWQEDAYEAD